MHRLPAHFAGAVRRWPDWQERKIARLFFSASCEAFERWADLERLDGVEVVLAAPSTAMVGSLFGHLFVRLAYRDEDGDARRYTLSRTVAFLADNDVPFEADPSLRP